MTEEPSSRPIVKEVHIIINYPTFKEIHSNSVISEKYRFGLMSIHTATLKSDESVCLLMNLRSHCRAEAHWSNFAQDGASFTVISTNKLILNIKTDIRGETP